MPATERFVCHPASGKGVTNPSPCRARQSRFFFRFAFFSLRCLSSPSTFGCVRGSNTGAAAGPLRPLSTHSTCERTTKAFPFGFSLTTMPRDRRKRFCAAEAFNGAQISAISASERNIGAVIQKACHGAGDSGLQRGSSKMLMFPRRCSPIRVSAFDVFVSIFGAGRRAQPVKHFRIHTARCDARRTNNADQVDRRQR